MTNFVEKITHPAGFIRFADVTVHDSSTSLFNAEEVEIEKTVLMPETTNPTTRYRIINTNKTPMDRVQYSKYIRS